MTERRDTNIQGKTKSIVYFEEEGRANLEATLNIVEQRWKDDPDLPITLFSYGAESALTLRERLGNSCKIIAVSYPHKRPLGDANGEMIYAETSKDEVVAQLEKANVPLIKGIGAFDDILLPRAGSVKHHVIRETLNLLSGGMELAVNAIVMACSAGYIDQGRRVISFSADTAIVGIASLHEFMFHPGDGLEIKEILCKPENLTKTRPRKEWKEQLEDC